MRKHTLIGDERTKFATFAESSLAVGDEHEMRNLLEVDLAGILPHDGFVAVLARLQPTHVLPLISISNNVSSLFTSIGKRVNNHMPDRTFLRWAQERKPQIFECQLEAEGQLRLSQLKNGNVANVIVHGQCDLQSSTTSIFAFFRTSSETTTRHAQILELLVPHLHLAFSRLWLNETHERSELRPDLRLTPRESDVLQLLVKGKSNKEIAKLLLLGVSTVRNHVHSVYLKLGVHNRAEAICKSLRLRLTHGVHSVSSREAAQVLAHGVESF